MSISDNSRQERQAASCFSRRDFAKIAAVGGSPLTRDSAGFAKVPEIPPGIKIATGAANPTPEKIHFRNVTSPLPHFTETLMDDGYYDMYRVMEALVEVNFDGIVIPDHILGVGDPPDGTPRSGGPPGFRSSPGLAYSIGCLNATLKAVLSNKRKA